MKVGVARQLDADHSINHRKQNLVAEVDRLPDHRGVDVVPDCVAGDIWQKGLAVLAHGGHLVTCGCNSRWAAHGRSGGDLTQNT
jgi:NADPH:quinone reductase-like Zn-dependent oxidoreductase